MGRSDVDGVFKKFDSLLRISIGIARLKLKSIVDIEDANEAMHMLQQMLGEFAKYVGIPRDPRDVR
jgi:DNA replicative helicase MCM subunit Mcm2 (Cdc46/Mcm family)